MVYLKNASEGQMAVVTDTTCNLQLATPSAEPTPWKAHF